MENEMPKEKHRDMIREIKVRQKSNSEESEQELHIIGY